MEKGTEVIKDKIEDCFSLSDDDTEQSSELDGEVTLYVAHYIPLRFGKKVFKSKYLL